MGGCYVVVSKEMRLERAEQRAKELELARESPKETGFLVRNAIYGAIIGVYSKKQNFFVMVTYTLCSLTRTQEKTLIRSSSCLSTSTQDAQLLVVVDSGKEPSDTQTVGALQATTEFDEETIEADVPTDSDSLEAFAI